MYKHRAQFMNGIEEIDVSTVTGITRDIGEEAAIIDSSLASMRNLFKRFIIAVGNSNMLEIPLVSAHPELPDDVYTTLSHMLEKHRGRWAP